MGRRLAVGSVLVVVAASACAPPAELTGPRGAAPWPAHVYAYEWQALSETTVDALSEPLSAFARFGGTAVALDVSHAVDISELPDEQDRSGAQAQFDAALSKYVAAAAASGLEVEALAGSPTWISPDTRYLTGTVIEFVYRYNRAIPADRRLSAIQFDLEPWGTPQWTQSAPALTTQLLDTVAYVADVNRQQPPTERVPVVFALPFWLDGTAAPSSIRHDGLEMSPTEHVMRLLDDGSGAANAVTIMAYRDFTAGPNGTLAITAREFEMAEARGGRVKVRVGQEISDVEPSRITFHQEGAQSLSSAISTIAGSYGSKDSFGGVAINDLASLAAAL